MNMKTDIRDALIRSFTLITTNTAKYIMNEGRGMMWAFVKRDSEPSGSRKYGEGGIS
jgi:hypothetical protein